MSRAAGLDGKVAVVTGATGGMGRVIALALARRGARVVTVARDPRRADPLQQQIVAEVGADRFDVIPGDLSRRDDVLAAADHIADRHDAVHILVNNAGAHFPDRRESVDGVEMHVALDHLAGFGLTVLLNDPLILGHASIVNVVSDSLNDTRQVKLRRRPRPVTLDTAQLADLRAISPEAGFKPFEAYARAKLLTVMAGYEAARRLTPYGVTVNFVHPGLVATDIINDLVPALLTPFTPLIRGMLLSPEQGASATLRLVTDPGLSTTTGAYFVKDAKTATSAASNDLVIQEKVWNLSAAHFGIVPTSTDTPPAPVP